MWMKKVEQAREGQGKFVMEVLDLRYSVGMQTFGKDSMVFVSEPKSKRARQASSKANKKKSGQVQGSLFFSKDDVTL